MNLERCAAEGAPGIQNAAQQQPPSSTNKARKRQRTSCDRCKLRKQRCDFTYNTCSNCEKAGLPCSRPRLVDEHASEDRDYVRALENHIAQLETKLATADKLTDEPIATVYELNDQESQQSSRPTSHLGNIVGLLSIGNADSPAYIGSSSGYAIATSLDEMVHATVWNSALWLPLENGSKQETTEAASMRIPVSEIRAMTMEAPSDTLGTRLIETYLTRIHPRFPIIVRSDLWEYHNNRTFLISCTTPNKEQAFSRFVLYMIYAMGALNLRLTSTYNDTSPETFYVAALQYVSRAREASPMHNIQAMILLILYHLRTESHKGLWQMAGLAMRTATDMGLHREVSTRSLPPFEAQMQRRLFWSLYYLEGVLASTLGRPISLSDTDIDQPLPLSISDDEKIFPLFSSLKGKEAYPYTNMTQAVLLFQLRRLESRIQRTVYRVDKPTINLLPKLSTLYTALELWREEIPPEITTAEKDRPLLHYYKAMRLLIQPFLSMLGPGDPYFHKCVEASGQICQIHKRLQGSPEYGHSFVAIHTVFLSGITLLYCLWLGGQETWSFGISNDIRACSCVLSIMGERAPNIRRYRDAFEKLVETTMAALETPRNQVNATDLEGQPQNDAANSFEFLPFIFNNGDELMDDTAWQMAKELAGWT